VHLPNEKKGFQPNVVVEWLTAQLRIWEVWGSNLGLKTGYPNREFLLFYSVSPGK
jgi:hypothetical protein